MTVYSNNARIRAINELIDMNHHRTIGFFTATEKNNDEYLDQLFFDNAFKSQGYAEELEMILKNTGGKHPDVSKNTDDVAIAWKNIASASRNNREALLLFCVAGEEAILQHYGEIIDSNQALFQSDEQYVIDEQLHEIEASYNKLKDLTIHDELTHSEVFMKKRRKQ